MAAVKEENDNNGNNLEDEAKERNPYASKSTIAQGMLDVALLTANAAQLKYLMSVGSCHKFYELMISMVVISIALQVTIGVLLMVQTGVILKISIGENGRNILQHFIVGLIFVSTFIDIMKSCLGFEPALQEEYNHVGASHCHHQVWDASLDCPTFITGNAICMRYRD